MKGGEGGQAGRRASPAAIATAMITRMQIAASAAGRYIEGRSHELSTLVWETKSPADFVSAVDVGAERVVSDLLLADEAWLGFDGDDNIPVRVVAEEGTPDLALSGAGITYVVDPLDGTTNFLHGYPWYAVSIGALLDGVLTAGVVLNVATGEMFSATLGGGATRGDKPIHVASNADPSRALIGTGFPFKQLQHLDAYQRQFAAVTRRTAGIRRAGAAALDLCDVACGRFDAFWELTLAPWDVAAGILIVREAGGIVTDVEGRDATVKHGAIVAGSPAMHPWLLNELGVGSGE
jgi:myo-inositol-1(or 4)-monophosphatase